MKKHALQIIAGLLLSFITSCSTGSGTVTPVVPATPTSTFNITYNGKSYHSTTPDVVSAFVSAPGNSPDWGVSINMVSTHIRCNFTGIKYGSSGTAVGIYKSGNATGLPSTLLDVTDYDDANKHYTSNFNGLDTASTITVITNTANECKGTFNIILTYNGTSYPATGDFDYKH